MQCLKFGGSSLATAERFQNAAQIVALKPVNRICVCSAPGKHRPDEQKITDLLIRFAQTKEKEDGKRAAGEILARCRQIEKELCIPEAKLPSDKLAKELIEASLAQTPEEQKLREDFLLPLGEIFSAHIMLYCLQQKGLKTRFVDPARAGLLLSDDKDGRTVNPACRERLCTSLSVALQEADVLVIPGFYGADKEGRRRVMPRGGSDLTAAWAAASLHIACDIYSDVSGVYEADPAAIPAARPIPSLSYAEMQAMAEYGAKVLHKDAVFPLEEAKLKLRILNSFEPAAKGSLIRVETEERLKPIAVSWRPQENTENAFIALIGSGLEKNPGIQENALSLLRLVDKKSRKSETFDQLPALVFQVEKKCAKKAAALLYEKLVGLHSRQP